MNGQIIKNRDKNKNKNNKNGNNLNRGKYKGSNSDDDGERKVISGTNPSLRSARTDSQLTFNMDI